MRTTYRYSRQLQTKHKCRYLNILVSFPFKMISRRVKIKSLLTYCANFRANWRQRLWLFSSFSYKWTEFFIFTLLIIIIIEYSSSWANAGDLFFTSFVLFFEDKMAIQVQIFNWWMMHWQKKEEKYRFLFRYDAHRALYWFTQWRMNNSP